MTNISNLTADGWYFEDFTVGDAMRHARGKTVGEIENVMFTNLVMNTADGHFNEHKMKGSPVGTRIVFGGITISLVIGLSSQETATNSLAELGMDKLRLKKPVLHGDTLYAITEVLETSPSAREDAGIVRLRHIGVNEKDEIVFEGERSVLMKRCAFWSKK